VKNTDWRDHYNEFVISPWRKYFTPRDQNPPPGKPQGRRRPVAIGPPTPASGKTITGGQIIGKA